MSKKPVRRRRGRHTSRPKAPSLPKEVTEVAVSAVGAKGDGLAKNDAGIDYFIPYSVAGDVVAVKTVDKRGSAYVGDIQHIITPGDTRVDAPCPHYTKCGGCSLQHLSASAYEAWKKERVQEALSRSDISNPVEDPILIGPGQRRRASFAVMKKGKKIVFGFNTRSSHRIEEIDHCLLLTPALDKMIGALRTLMPAIMKQEGRGDVIINYPDGPCDITFALPGRLELKAHEELVRFAETHDVGRLSWQENGKGEPETILQRAVVTTTFASTSVELPPSPFLQPSKEGEDALAKFVLGALAGTEKKILDLYAGCGSFTFVLAEKAIVHAVESNGAALKTLELSAGRNKMGGRITTEVRDLSRQPLMGKELEKYDALLFDPPRAGAKEQAEEIAQSDIPLVIAISCNPATFARDAAALIDGGYSLDKVIPVDQFTWSAHVEVAAIFTKNKS
ncbi:class I SAM-dependent RNA methyltransferase [Terasakiella sp. A23]|uniref:class I SAM-dependent RNA methyltransferase n=1 Tax=Terasakiella sp. FCG-A23 TaxID=3080561 RepID=UPI002955D9E4|nr:class I SAM-dependent RNA methyltransferase [Terasakiella sp. A23]MDV7339983.1 class I SAM-dependent RNA methyltransferase [Terasakiella sp. A23]